MKQTIVLLLILAGAGWWMWRQRQAPPETGGEPEVPATAAPAPASPAPRATPTAVPGLAEPARPPVAAEPDPGPEDRARALNERVRDCLRIQAGIEVPHALADRVEVGEGVHAEATVIRLEPDGLHVRHAQGLEKIPFESMPEAWRTVYGMDAEVVDRYREIMRQRAQAHREEQAQAAAQADRERQGEREAHGARLEQIERDREEAELARRRQVWHRYDMAMEEYRARMYSYERARRQGRTASRPTRPRPPPYPRP